MHHFDKSSLKSMDIDQLRALLIINAKNIGKEKKGSIKKYCLLSFHGEVLSEIESILEARPTYGYKRITAMIDRKRRLKGLQKYNKKRIARVMDINGLLQVQEPTFLVLRKASQSCLEKPLYLSVVKVVMKF